MELPSVMTGQKMLNMVLLYHDNVCPVYLPPRHTETHVVTMPYYGTRLTN